MKEIVLHDRGIVPILVNLDKLFVVRIVFGSSCKNSYYVCRKLPNPNFPKSVWMFFERSFPTKYSNQLLDAKSIQEACQAIMNMRSTSYTLSLWVFDTESEMQTAILSGAF